MSSPIRKNTEKTASWSKFFCNFEEECYIDSGMDGRTERRGISMNIKEVAKVAGVSVASISRAFQNPPSPSVSPRQRERILRICEELHYYPDIHSRRMSRKRANTVTLLSRYGGSGGRGPAGDLHFDYNFAAITMGIQYELGRCGKSLQLVQLTDRFLEERQHLIMVRSKMTDGVLFWGALSDDACVRELMEEKIPLVLLTTGVNGSNCPKAAADEYGGMKLVVEAALKAGHRRFAFLPPLTGGSSGAERERAVRETLSENGLTPVWTAPAGGFEYSYGVEMGRKFLADKPPASCIIASNDMAAWGCIHTLTAAGIRIPDDLSVTGADGLPFSGLYSLTSFYLPSYEIGIEGTKMLISMMDDGVKPPSSVIPVSFIQGNSILPPAAE